MSKETQIEFKLVMSRIMWEMLIKSYAINIEYDFELCDYIVI